MESTIKCNRKCIGGFKDYVKLKDITPRRAWK